MASPRKLARIRLTVRCVREAAIEGASQDGHLGQHPFPHTASEAHDRCAMPGQRPPSLEAWAVFWACSEAPDAAEPTWRKEEAGTEGVGTSTPRRAGGPWGWSPRDHLSQGPLWDCMPTCVGSVCGCVCVCVWGGDCCFGAGTRERFYRFLRTHCEAERRKQGGACRGMRSQPAGPGPLASSFQNRASTERIRAQLQTSARGPHANCAHRPASGLQR